MPQTRSSDNNETHLQESLQQCLSYWRHMHTHTVFMLSDEMQRHSMKNNIPWRDRTLRSNLDLD